MSLNTIKIRGTLRLIFDKDKYGLYHLLLDEKDLRWLKRILKEVVKG
jgi:hypothetical protein